LTASISAAQGLVITSPPDGTVVKQGDVVLLRVKKNDPKIVDVQAAGDLLSVRSDIQNNVSDMTFEIRVPATKQPGTYRVGALGVGGTDLSTAASAFAGPINIVVAPQTDVTSIFVSPASLYLEYVGVEKAVRVGGVNGSYTTGLTESSSPPLTYRSSNPAVASVDTKGRVLATGPGQTTVEVSYGNLKTSVPISVPLLTRGDLNGDSKINIDDVNILTTALNGLATGPNDSRDLNHDGKIDALDVRILTTLCTKPRCAR
jgi:hypothetical protein